MWRLVDLAENRDADFTSIDNQAFLFCGPVARVGCYSNAGGTAFVDCISSGTMHLLTLGVAMFEYLI